MPRTAMLAATACALVAGVVAPALAAKPIHSCYDFAWESQEQKDCLANPDMLKHMGHHKGMKHEMRGKHMKHMEHMDMKKS